MTKKIWFASDLHLSHKNICAFSPERLNVLGLHGKYPKDDVLAAFKMNKSTTATQAQRSEAKGLLAAVTKDMDRAIIEQWNATVGFSDDVYILGDVSFAKTPTETANMLTQMNGRLHLIRGNHDHGTDKLDRWEWVRSYTDIRVDGVDVVMFHFPIWEWDKMHRGSYHLFGHVHGKSHPIEGRCMDIAMESIKAVAISWEDVHHKLSKLPVRSHHDAEREKDY
jgi:calcineurin-like phosphoesterase family protein